MSVRLGRWHKVSKIIGLFVAMGCEVRHSDGIGALHGPDGRVHFRFLYCLETDGIASLSGYDDDDFVPHEQVENWQRLLGVDIPLGECH